jgi:hypothetical protein
LREEIGIPANCEIAAAIIMGYPKTIPETTQRNELIVLKSIYDSFGKYP